MAIESREMMWPTMTYEADLRSVKKQRIHKMSVTVVSFGFKILHIPSHAHAYNQALMIAYITDKLIIKTILL